MPDVMKLMTICYVLPAGDVDDSTATLYASKGESSSASASTPDKDIVIGKSTPDKDIVIGKSEKVLNLPPLNMDKLYSGLTGPDSSESIDYTTPKCLDDLVVRPVTTLVRRLIAKSDNYQSIQGVQAKYRTMSILKKARQERVSKKKRRKRRDVVEIRSKITSKHNRMWQSLAKPSDEEKRKNKNKERKNDENRQKQESRVERKKEPVVNDFADDYHTIFSVNNSPYTSDAEKHSAGVKTESAAAVVVDLRDAASAEVISTLNVFTGAEKVDDAVSVNRSWNNSPVAHINMGFESNITTILEEVNDVENDLMTDNALTGSHPMDVVTSPMPIGAAKIVAVKSSAKPVRKNTTSTRKDNRRILSNEIVDSPARSELDGQHDRLVTAGDTPLRRSSRIKK